MKTANHYYEDTEKEDLQKLGFKFYKISGSNGMGPKWVKKEFRPKIEFADLDDLMRFVETWGTVILTKDTILIKDGWME